MQTKHIHKTNRGFGPQWLPAMCSGLLFLKIMSWNAYAWMQAKPGYRGTGTGTLTAGSSICHLPAGRQSQQWHTVAYSDPLFSASYAWDSPDACPHAHMSTEFHPSLQEHSHMPCCLWWSHAGSSLQTKRWPLTRQKAPFIHSPRVHLCGPPKDHFYWVSSTRFVKLFPRSNMNCYFPLKVRSQRHQSMARKTTIPSVK